MMEFFLIYEPRKLKFSCSEFTKYNTEIDVLLRDMSEGSFCSKYRDCIEQCPCKSLWTGILNEVFGWRFF